jgi:hypothetical protein
VREFITGVLAVARVVMPPATVHRQRSPSGDPTLDPSSSPSSLFLFSLPTPPRLFHSCFCLAYPSPLVQFNPLLYPQILTPHQSIGTNKLHGLHSKLLVIHQRELVTASPHGKFDRNLTVMNSKVLAAEYMQHCRARCATVERSQCHWQILGGTQDKSPSPSY